MINIHLMTIECDWENVQFLVGWFGVLLACFHKRSRLIHSHTEYKAARSSPLCQMQCRWYWYSKRDKLHWRRTENNEKDQDEREITPVSTIIHLAHQWRRRKQCEFVRRGCCKLAQSHQIRSGRITRTSSVYARQMTTQFFQFNGDSALSTKLKLLPRFEGWKLGLKYSKFIVTIITKKNLIHRLYDRHCMSLGRGDGRQ